jgi:hypothetical protein
MSMANYGRAVEVPIPREDDIPLGRDEYPSMREYIDEQIRLQSIHRGGLQGTDFERWNQDSNRNQKKIFLFYKKLYEKYLDTITDEEIERILREQGLTDADRRVVFSPGSPSVDIIQNIIQGYRRILNDIYGLTSGRHLYYPEGEPTLIAGGIFSPAHVQPYINDLFKKYMRLNKKIEIVMKLLDKCCKSSNFIDLKNEMEDIGQGNLFRSLFPYILPEASGKRKHRKTHKKKKSI